MTTEIAKIKKSKTILLVEDDSQDLELTLTALDDQSLTGRVVVVRDGAQALDFLYCRGEFSARVRGNPALVLLDNKMPKITGLEVLKTIRADEHLKFTPVVVLSSSREVSDVAACYQHGVNSYVVKPLYFEEFKKAIRELCIFWATVNEPPPMARAENSVVQSRSAFVFQPEEIEHEVPAHPAN